MLLFSLLSVVSAALVLDSPVKIKIPDYEPFVLSNNKQLPEDVVLSSKLSLSVSLKEPVQQVFVSAIYSAHESVTWAMEASGSSYSLSVDLKSDKVRQSLNHRPGTYKWVLYVSDGVETLQMPLGTVKVAIPDDPEARVLYKSDDVFVPLPEFNHIFRPDGKKPNGFLSLVFSMLLVSPWMILMLGFSSFGANAKNLFADAATTMYGSLFLGSLAAYVGLLVLYWLKLNMFQFLGYASILSLFTFFTGRQALVLRYKSRK